MSSIDVVPVLALLDCDDDEEDDEFREEREESRRIDSILPTERVCTISWFPYEVSAFLKFTTSQQQQHANIVFSELFRSHRDRFCRSVVLD